TYVESSQTDYIFGRRQIPGTTYWAFDYNYINQPLVEELSDGSKKSIIDSMSTFLLHAGVLVTQKTLVSMQVSFSKLSIEGADSETHLADSRLQLKYRISNNRDRWGFSILSELILPTGDDESYVSYGGFGGALQAIIERKYPWIMTSLNLGYQYIGEAIWEEIDHRNQIIAGLGFRVPVTNKLSLNAEGLGYISIGGQRHDNPGEYYFGGLYKFMGTYGVFAGVSVPSLESPQPEQIRGLVGLKFISAPERPQAQGPRCSIKPFSVTYNARVPTSEELQSLLPLPYASSSPPEKFIKIIRPGEMTELTGTGVPIVQDSQIPLIIEPYNLPPRKSVKSVKFANIKMSVTKLSQDAYLGTEIFCFLKQKICSGEVISSPKWKHSINWQYFDKNRRTANIYYAGQYLDNPVSEWKGHKVYSTALSLEMQQLLDGSSYSVLDILYKNETEAQSIPILIADDTFVSNDTRLELELSVEVCE
ncbi:MAG: transporter, partial [Bdellovibrio sp.]